jgi:hypothetical protein
VISWNIDLGALIQLAGFIGTIVYIAATVRGDVKAVKVDITDIKAELKALREVMMKQAEQSIRLDMLSQRIVQLDSDIRELRHGDGFVVPFPQSPK